MCRLGTRLDHILGVRTAWKQGLENQQSLGVNPGPQVCILHIKLCHLISGVARTSPLLGHSMGTLRLYELPRGHPPTPENLGILQPPKSVLRPNTVVKCKSLMANSRV